MTKFKFLIGLTALGLTLGMGVSAAELPVSISTDDTTAVMTVQGSATDTGYGEAVSVTVIKPNADGDTIDYSQKNLKEIIDADMLTAFMTVMTSKDGAYKAEISMKDSNPGDYTIVVSLGGEAPATETQSFYFATLENKTDFIKSVAEYLQTDGADSAGLAKLLDMKAAESKNAKLFAIGKESIIYKVSAAGFDKTVYEVLKAEKALAEMQPTDFVQKLEYAAKLAALAEGVIAPIDTVEDFKLDADFVKTYNDNLSDKQKQAFAELFKGEYMYTQEAVQKHFKDCICLAVIKNPSGWTDYTKLISSHGEYLGINMSGYKALEKPENVTDYMTSGYATIEAFASAANSAITTLSGGNSGGSGQTGGYRPSGGGGGFGGGVVSSSTSIAQGTITGNTATEAPQTTDGSFADLESVPWAEEYIKALVNDGILNGIGHNMFDPDGSVTREQFAKMAVLAAGLEPSDGETAFEDVEAGAWYAGYIKTAADNGIINGVSDTEFGIGANVTRQDAAAILYRLAGKPSFVRGEAFADDAEIADYAADAVYALKAAEIIGGRDDNAFCPQDTCTRAEAAKMIYMFRLKF